MWVNGNLPSFFLRDGSLTLINMASTVLSISNMVDGPDNAVHFATHYGKLSTLMQYPET